jgi:hypothetical protein
MTEQRLVETIPGPAGEKRLRATYKGRFVLNEIVLRLALSLEPERLADSPMDNRTAAN